MKSPARSIYLPSGLLLREMAEQACPGIHDISAHEVYLAPGVTTGTVSSYLAFSPLPAVASAKADLHWYTTGGLIFCGTFCLPAVTAGILPVRKHDALCCPDFPLSPAVAPRRRVQLRQQRQDGLLSAKIRQKIKKAFTLKMNASYSTINCLYSITKRVAETCSSAISFTRYTPGVQPATSRFIDDPVIAYVAVSSPVTE